MLSDGVAGTRLRGGPLPTEVVYLKSRLAGSPFNFSTSRLVDDSRKLCY